MAERVRELNLGVTWDPNAPDAVLVTDDSAKTVLAIRADSRDRDRRCVVLVWTGTRSATMADPNDEAISGHRLYQVGLSDVLWAGLVADSNLIRDLERQNRVHPYHDASWFDALEHHVVLLKECVVEVVAKAVAVERHEGSTLDAATAVIRI